MVERDLALAAYEGRPVHLQHLSARDSVDAPPRAPRRRRGERGGEPAPPLRDRRGRPLARPEHEDEPAAPHGGRPPALSRRSSTGRSTAIATDHAPHARHEKDVPFEEAPFGVIGLETAFAALHTYLVAPVGAPRDVARAHVGRAGARVSACRARGSRSASPRTSCFSISTRSGRCARSSSARAPRTRGSWAGRWRGRSSRPSRTAGSSSTREHDDRVPRCSRTAPSSGAAPSPRRASPSARRSSRPG